MADLNNTLVRGNLRVTDDTNISGDISATNVQASTFNGYSLSGGVGNNTIPIRDNNGYVYFNYINTNVGQENPSSYSGVSLLFTGSDGWIRKSSPSNVSVGYADSAGAVAWANVSGRPTTATTSVAGLVYLGQIEQNTSQQFLAGTVAPQGHTHSNYLTGITSSMVTDALGYTPYNSSNPNGYITSSGSCAYATSAGSAPASDVYSWAKESSKPSYTASEVGAAPTSHASSATTYGVGSSSDYGHVKLKYAWASNYLNGYALGINQSTSGSTTTSLSGFSGGSKTTRGQAYLKLAVTNEDPPLSISSGVGSLFLQTSNYSAEYFADKIVVTSQANLAIPTYYTLNLPRKDGTLATTDDINYYPVRDYSTGLKISGYVGSTDCQLYVPYMTDTQYGVAKCAVVRSSSISSSAGATNGNYYGVEKDSNGKLFVCGPKRYEHNIFVLKSGKINMRFTYLSSSSTALNTYSKLRAALYGAGYDHSGYGNLLMASGTMYDSSVVWNISGVGAGSADSGGIYIFLSRMSSAIADDNKFIYSSDSCSYYDYVRDLIGHDNV